MKITVLAENTPGAGLEAEHGLSLLVETADCRFLFDMGQTDLFARNARALGVDLREADFAVLSHGHYDHGGGLGTFLTLNDRAPVYINRSAFEPHYNAADRYIGLDPALEGHDRLVIAADGQRIAPGLTLFCRDPAGAGAFDTGGLQVLEEGRLQPEDFRHEQYLLAEEGGKKILFSGCSHRGILRIMDRYRPDVLIGGFHLSKLPLDGALRDYGRELNAFPAVYWTCHCTGVPQYRFLRQTMRNLRYLKTGDRIEV